MKKRTADEVIADARPDAVLQRELRRTRENLRETEKQLGLARERLQLIERVDNIVVEPPKWLARQFKGVGNRGIVTLLLSDTHFDEVVNPDEVEGVNAYNREIAVRRLRMTHDKTIGLSRDFFKGLAYDGAALLLGGDMLSGAIHEELTESNEDTVYGSLDFWSEHLTAFVRGLADHFGQLHVWGVVGNHGRRTRKPRAKFRAKDNLDWLLYRMVAKATRDVATWTIPESADVDLTIYNTRFRLTHGDQFRGGGGIAGMMSPILKGRGQKAHRQMTLGKPFDWLVMGHWHQYLHGLGIIVNSSLKGIDEYAYVANFGIEPPAQAAWITTPEHGPAFPMPIFPADRKGEKW